MYDIDYYLDGESKNFHIKSNHLPQTDDDITINGKNYQVIEVQHILNSSNLNLKAWESHTLDEKFIVTIHEKKI